VIPAARVAARVLTACTVLVGLVFMHGVGAASGTGCPGGIPSMASSAVPAMGGGHDAAMADVITTVPGTVIRTSAPISGHSSVCDSTPPRGDLTGRLAHAATGLAQPGALGKTLPAVERSGGARPRAGPALLISLGVSRT
jgi:hypothetical protein